MRVFRLSRTWVTLLLAVLLALVGLATVTSPAQAATTDIRINEVEANGSPDWVEFVNTGGTAQSLQGLVLRDDSDAADHTWTIPAGYTVPANGRLTIDGGASTFSFGLGNGGDKVRLFQADGTTIIDSFTWTAAAGTGNTWSRCADTTGTSFVAAASSKNAANVCAAPAPTVKLNEIESTGGTPADWIELVNTGASTTDISGVKVSDNDNTHVYTVPASTTVAAGGYYVIEQAQLGFELDDADSARLFATDGTTSLDSYTWTSPATATYGRCPDATGTITSTQIATKGAKNNCPGDIVADPWPGGTTVTTVDDAGLATSNMSGLVYEGTGTTTPGTLWAVRNGGPEALYKLVKSGASWVPDAGDWAAGKQLRYADGTGQPDAEGVTLTDAGSAGGMFVATERNNAVNTVSRPAILRFAPNTAGTSLNATNDWNLTADLPAVAANSGLEGIAWVPDSYLTAKGFKTSGGTAYNPADYTNHGNGLFFVGVEANGMVYAYALDLTGSTYTRVASFASGFPAVMELHYEKETQKLWVACDDTCQGRTARFDISTAAGASQGTFVASKYYERPTGMANLNNEGFTTTPRSECVAGVKPVFWSDDNDTGGNSLRVGTLSCTVPVAQAVTFTSIAPAAPVVGATYTPTATSGGASGNAVVISIATASASVCTLTGGVVTFNHPGSCVVKADQAGNDDNAPGTAQQTLTVSRASTSTETKVLPTTLRATVAAVAPGAGTPTGAVVFVLDGTQVGSAPLTAGVATLSYTLPQDGMTHAVVGTYQGSVDYSGSASSATRSDPEISATVSSQETGRSADGWYRTPVTVSFTCTTHGSALTTDCPVPVTLGTSGADQSITRTVTANDGGSATITVGDLDIDMVDPTVAIQGVKAGKTYTSKKKPTCVGDDTLSGLSTCTVSQERQGKKYLVTAVATDLAGNVTTTTLTYKVVKKKRR